MDRYLKTQLESWTLAADNYRALQSVETKRLSSGTLVQFNPARMVSTGAKMDAATIKARPCFLCHANRPLQQLSQRWGEYEILVNPFPIFPRHFTLPLRAHAPQRIYGRVADMARLAQMMDGYTIFYNGPHCGASAPDHMHFQAGNSDFLPLWDQIADVAYDEPTAVSVFGSMPIIVLRSKTPEAIESAFKRLYAALPQSADEPMLNALMRYVDGDYVMVVIPRGQHRPSFYGDGEDQMILSPASVDLAGAFITPRRTDFDRFDDLTAERVYKELCLSMDQVKAICRACKSCEVPMVSVGVLSAPKLEFTLNGQYLLDGDPISGKVSLSVRGFKEDLMFVHTSDDCFVEVKDVTIGVNFHWQRHETQCFKGDVKIVHDNGELVLINIINIEDYLTSVISSEMSATSSIELLKAHAVISRSWVLAQIRSAKTSGADSQRSQEISATRRIVWYDHDDHTLFDVCADDHCQRYQGITRASTQAVADAIAATRGEVLVADGALCDARFSKCCGGVFERFENCWEDSPKSYLVPRRDWSAEMDYPDLTNPGVAEDWILSSPQAYCNTQSASILRQVLNHYDQETADFFRWQVEYDTDTLSDLIHRKTGIDFGRIIDLVPLQRGSSGRIVVLRIIGEKRTMDIGKELEIRRALSESHLYSSAFVVEHTPRGFRLRGAGWGHGVGLCQIGAAVMAHSGFDYKKILSHYYPGSEIAGDYFSK